VPKQGLAANTDRLKNTEPTPGSGALTFAVFVPRGWGDCEMPAGAFTTIAPFMRMGELQRTPPGLQMKRQPLG
jgi:hypothetical protein